MTFTMFNPGSYGRFHPLYNPAVNVYVDGKLAHRAENAREGMLWAIREGHEPEDADLLDSPRYQELLAQARYERVARDAVDL